MRRRVCFAPKKPAQHHSSALSAKVELRRWLVEQLGGKPRVLDCFCAKGTLWERAYESTPRYLGLDLRQFDDVRRTIVCDSRRFLRHVDVRLEDFDLFDLDAFGSPLEHLAIICNRIRVERGRRVGFCLTDGTGMPVAMNSTSRGLLAYVGIAVHRRARVQLDYRHEIFGMALRKALETAGLRQIAARRAERASGVHSKGREIVYLALVAEGE